MQWQTYPEHKPQEDCLCYVTNVNASSAGWLCDYCYLYDVFYLHNESIDRKLMLQPSLAVTHYIIIPRKPPLIKRINPNHLK